MRPTFRAFPDSRQRCPRTNYKRYQQGRPFDGGDGRRTPSYGIEQFVEFRSRHRFSCFGDIQISSSKGEFDEVSDLRVDQSRRFLTRRGERNRQGSPFDPRQYLERNPHQKLVDGGVAILSEIGVLGHDCYRVLLPTRSNICNEIR